METTLTVMVSSGKLEEASAGEGDGWSFMFTSVIFLNSEFLSEHV